MSALPTRFRLPPVLALCVLGVGCVGCATSSRVAYRADQPNPASPPTGGFAFGLRMTTVILSGTSESAKAATPPAENPAPQAGAPNLNVPPAGGSPPKQQVGSSSQGSGHAKPHTPGSPPPAATTPADQGNDTAAKEDKKAGNPPATGLNTPLSTIRTQLCAQKDDWGSCLDKVQLSSASITDTRLPPYVAKPDPPHFYRTTLTPKVDTTDPLFISSVTFNTTSTLPARITQAGADAAVGLAFSPAGAIAGGLVGFLLPVPPPAGGAAPKAAPPAFLGLLCTADRSRFVPFDAPAAHPDAVAPLELWLPITLDVDKIEDGSAVNPACWHVMPTTDNALGDDGKNKRPTQWFFRVLNDAHPDQPPSQVPPVITDTALLDKLTNEDGSPVIVARADYFKEKGWSASRESFPMAACRTATLQIAHLSELRKSSSLSPVATVGRQYPLVVADPSYVQVVNAPVQGSVTLLPLCGGYASAGQPGTPLTDSVNALLQAVQKIKSGQAKSN